MTNQEAAKILRTEQIGDSEQMELAKQMGAHALDVLSGTDIKSRDLLKYGEAVSQGYQDGMKDAEQWRQYRERIISDVGDAAFRAGEALGRAVCGICDFTRAMVDFMAKVIPDNLRGVVRSAAEMKAALNEAPPRVRHLALHSKKHRTCKKNINRALREYRRKEKRNNAD